MAPSGGGIGGGKATGPSDHTLPEPKVFRTLNIDTPPDAAEAHVVFMAIVRVKLMANGRTMDAYALLDQGANSSLITDILA